MTPSSTATISKEQRDGLYALVRNHLGGLSDVFVEMEQRKDFDAPSASVASSPRISGCWRTSAGSRMTVASRSP